ncbi:hypothetical protein T05_1534 [Trichinella murrelli]|uniref:Retrovirus-related Pol polyprotein from transposon TNT 1-94 n=1 Tax=Trichinella murrelli TaxID=144512 RepID=A0A0V0TC24_9BILA|nr:hypothetical protein T05_1534 [Trichinella murrelli]
MSGMATDSVLGKPVIAKLNSLNYQLWKLKMKVPLMRDGLWDLVSQPKPCPISEDWSLKECKAIAAMSHGRIRPSYPFCATANCPGNVTNAIATRALGYAKILMYKMPVEAFSESLKQGAQPAAVRPKMCCRGRAMLS